MRKIQGGVITTVLLVSLLIVLNSVSAADCHVYSGQSIQTAINNASSGDTIYVHAGTYNENLLINSKNLSLIGDGASMTTIDGGGSLVVDVRSGATVNISGFTITNGGTGVRYRDDSSGIITNNTITGNGYGIYNDSSSPTITNNTITGNTLHGIVNFLSSNPTITNNTITGNQFGIVNFLSSNPTITNNTITGNTWYGIRNVSSSPTITNNIVFSNGVFGIYDYGTGSPLCTYNNFWGNGTDYVNVTPGIGSISQDPQLDGTYHLTSSSPCIDAGTDAGVYTDMDGDSRPQGSGFDIGADEYVPQVINPIAAFLPVKNYHLAQVNAYFGCIEENLPGGVPEDIQDLLDEMQEHIDNANTTGNTIYANNELLKALDACDEIARLLGITCS